MQHILQTKRTVELVLFSFPLLARYPPIYHSISLAKQRGHLLFLKGI